MYVAGLLRREPRIAPWSITTTPSRPATEPWISELLPEPATPVITQSTPSGMSTSTSWRLCVDAPRTSSAPEDERTDSLRVARSSRWRPVDGVALPQPLHGALEADGAALRAGAGAEVDDVVGDRDGLGLVLHDEHGVALVPQLQQQVVHPLDVMGVQADRGLVEDVGDVGERRAEVADHLGALRLSAGQRARRPVEREVAQPDLRERVEEVLQPGEQRGHRRLVEVPDPVGQVADLHRADVGDVLPLDLRRPGLLAEPGAVAVGAGRERHRPLHEGADVRLQRVDVLGQDRLLDLAGSGPRTSG